MRWASTSDPSRAREGSDLAQETAGLGGRLPLIPPGTLKDAAKALYIQLLESLVPWADAAGFQARTPDGRLIGPFNAILFSPELCRSFLGLQKIEEARTALSGRARQVVILSVGSVCRAPYELYALSAVARRAGLDEQTIDVLVRGQPAEALDEPERIAQIFTQQLEGRRRVDALTYKAARTAFGEKGVVDMIVLAGCYQLVCSFLNAFEIPAPQSAV